MGRPPIGKGILVGVRLRPEDVKTLDWHIGHVFQRNAGEKAHGLKPMTRPEAIRFMLQSQLESMSLDMQKKTDRAAKRAEQSAKKEAAAKRRVQEHK